MKKITLYLSDESYRPWKVKLAEDGMSATSFFQQAVDAYLAVAEDSKPRIEPTLEPDDNLPETFPST